MGDATKTYCSTTESVARLSNIPLLLGTDHFEKVEGLTITGIQSICTNSIFNKAKRYEVVKSNIISAQVYPITNTIEGEFRAARIHDQLAGVLIMRKIQKNLFVSSDYELHALANIS